MTESFISTSEFEVASNAVNNILGQPVEEIEITDILPPLNDITDLTEPLPAKAGRFGLLLKQPKVVASSLISFST